LKTLHLTLKKKWFDMIVSGEKKEEYREIKPYWSKRLTNGKYDRILFKNGYSRGCPSVMVALRDISQSLGIVEWGAPEGEMVYILRLGQIIS